MFKFKIPPIHVQEAIVREKHRLEDIKKGKVNDNKDIPASYRRYDEGWQKPSPEEITETFAPFTQDEIIKMLGFEETRSVRRWKSGEKDISYAAWRLFLILTGRVKVSD